MIETTDEKIAALVKRTGDDPEGQASNQRKEKFRHRMPRSR